jgi:hypothetical protein
MPLEKSTCKSHKSLYSWAFITESGGVGNLVVGLKNLPILKQIHRTNLRQEIRAKGSLLKPLILIGEFEILL